MTVKVVAPSGGDYTTLTAWEAAAAATLSAPWEADCRVFSGGLSETGGVVISGITTSAANYLRIYSDSSNQHTGIAASGFYVKSNSGSGGTLRWGANIDYCRLEAIEVVSAGTDAAFLYTNGVTAVNNDVRFERCIIHSPNATPGSFSGGTNLKYYNNITYSGGANRGLDFRGTAADVENCTFYNQGGDYGILQDTTTGATTKNCYSGGSATQDFWTGGSGVGNNNASADTSATAGAFTSSYASKAGSSQFTSVTASSEDFRLLGSAFLLDQGATLGAITTDCILTPRPQGSAYDIGAIERVVSSSFIAQRGLNLNQAPKRASYY